MFDEHAKNLEMCNACPSLCQSSCPVFVDRGNRTVSPWGLMQAMNRVRRGEISYTDEIGAASYDCLTCRSCTASCEHGVDVSSVMREARNEAVRLDVAPKSVTGFLEKFHRHNNPFSKDLLTRLKEIAGPNIYEKQAQVVYYASCTTIAKCPEVIADTFELFHKLKIDFVGLFTDPIQCCGYPLAIAGAENDFIDIAEINFHSLNRYKLIITGSPACAYTLKNTYADYDMSLGNKIVTINQFLKPYLKNINYRVRKNLRSKVLFHDPCYQSRYLGEIELPRDLIAQVTGTQPTEFFENREKSMCSGQGGCYSIVNKESANTITERRLNEAHEKKINCVITQCPSCIFKMRTNSRKIIVKDLVSYLNDCIEGTIS